MDDSQNDKKTRLRVAVATITVLVALVAGLITGIVMALLDQGPVYSISTGAAAFGGVAGLGLALVAFVYRG
jgi:hypothetical protein